MSLGERKSLSRTMLQSRWTTTISLVIINQMKMKLWMKEVIVIFMKLLQGEVQEMLVRKVEGEVLEMPVRKVEETSSVWKCAERVRKRVKEWKVVQSASSVESFSNPRMAIPNLTKFLKCSKCVGIQVWTLSRLHYFLENSVHTTCPYLAHACIDPNAPWKSSVKTIFCHKS